VPRPPISSIHWESNAFLAAARASKPAATPTAVPDSSRSKVIVTRGGVWWEGALEPDLLRVMIDASIASLIGLRDDDAAWASLFAPHERIAIKVNTRMASAEVLGNAILMSSYPVAHDVIGLTEFVKTIEADGQNSASCVKLASDWLAKSAKLGLGNNSIDHIECLEILID
jgi:hypothetical protein